MKLYWTNKCIENEFKCPKCQNTLGTKSGQMPANSKNHRINLLDGQVKCAVCNTTVGYFPSGNLIFGMRIKLGVSEKILSNFEYTTAIKQNEF